MKMILHKRLMDGKLAYDKTFGLLINFGVQSLKFKKICNTGYNPVNPKIN